MSEAARTPKLPPAYRLRAFDALGSTNDEALLHVTYRF